MAKRKAKGILSRRKRNAGHRRLKIAVVAVVAVLAMFFVYIYVAATVMIGNLELSQTSFTVRHIGDKSVISVVYTVGPAKATLPLADAFVSAVAVEYDMRADGVPISSGAVENTVRALPVTPTKFSVDIILDNTQVERIGPNDSITITIRMRGLVGDTVPTLSKVVVFAFPPLLNTYLKSRENTPGYLF